MAFFISNRLSAVWNIVTGGSKAGKGRLELPGYHIFKDAKETAPSLTISLEAHQLGKFGGLPGWAWPIGRETGLCLGGRGDLKKLRREALKKGGRGGLRERLPIFLPHLKFLII
jgi:hypothetical protein